MKRLLWNFEKSQHIRKQIQLWLAVLPIGMMFASFAPIYLLASLLASNLGIPIDAPVKDQPNGMLFIIIFLASMVVMMIAGALLGWVSNGIVLRVFFKWPKERVIRVFKHSEIPESWLKDSDATAANAGGKNGAGEANETWAVTRQMGRGKFVFQRGVLTWGSMMYVLMAVLPAVNGKAHHTLFYFLWQACLWGAAGALFGFLIWHLSEKSFQKQNG